MSAYDNPTIIKDDSALIWGQAAGGFAESFTQSYATAKKEREAKEKEAKLDAEKKAKEDKDQKLNNQVFLSELRYKDQARIGQIQADLEKKGASKKGTELVADWEISTGNVEGMNNLSINTVVQNPEDLNKKNEYATLRKKGEANLLNATGGLYSQADAIKSGKINDTNIANYRFIGRTTLDQSINRATAFSLAFEDAKKSTKDLVYDANGDPSDITLLINTNMGTKADVLDFFTKTNPAMTAPALLEKEFQKGLDDGVIIKSGAKGQEQYAFKYKREINSDYDGSLYVEIPQIEYGKSSITAGVYSDENDDKINQNFIGKFNYENIAGNAGVNKGLGTVKYERQEVLMDKILAEMNPALRAKANGLIASSLQNPDVADGVLSDLGFGPDFYSATFSGMNNDEKITALVEKMKEKEKQKIISRSDLKLEITKDKKETYYIQNEKDNQIFSNPSQPARNNPTEADLNAVKLANKTNAVMSQVNNSSYMDPITSPDGNKRIIFGANGWIAKNKSGGNWVVDKDYSGITDKKELAQKFLFQ